MRINEQTAGAASLAQRQRAARVRQREPGDRMFSTPVREIMDKRKLLLAEPTMTVRNAGSARPWS
jgi:hypothetical protein